MRLILYSKPGCHLCEGLKEKLEQVQSLDLELEVRDITTRGDWFQAYQYEIPVLFLLKETDEEMRNEGTADSSILHSSSLIPLPRLSPRATVSQLEQMLQKYLQTNPPQ